jgi:hypothetical protein
MKHILLIIPILVILFSCKKNEPEPTPIPRIVFVETKGGIAIDSIFKIINSFKFGASIYKGYYTSNLPPDSLLYVRNYLYAKSYTFHGQSNAAPTVSLVQDTISVFENFQDMENIVNQNDWLNSMQVLQLHETPVVRYIYFSVPEGAEMEWVEKFKQYSFCNQTSRMYNYPGAEP